MYLVHQKKDSKKWEVAWMWVPHFIAADLDLVKHVDATLSEQFKGLEIPTEEKYREIAVESLSRTMHDRVVDLVTDRYPIHGLKEYLQCVLELRPEERA